MEKNKIAFVTCVSNFDLYNITSKFFPKEIKSYAVDGRNGLYSLKSIIYIINRLKKTKIEWLILIDEDAILLDNHVIFELISYIQAEKITVCGMRDGGVLDHRSHNPYVLNTFFNIINYKEVVRCWNESEMLDNQFILKNEFDDNLEGCQGPYDKLSLFEPYYCFYLWLRRLDKKSLFLESQVENDNIANKLYFGGKPFLLHTWYGRNYGILDEETERINGHLNNALKLDNQLLSNEYTLLNSSTFSNIIKSVKRGLKSLLFNLPTK